MSDALVIRDNTAYGKSPGAGGNTFYTDGGSRYVKLIGNTSYDNPIGEMYFGPPPKSGDPLPYSSTPSDANSFPYGSEIGGCVTYGQIEYRGNSWFEDPLSDQIPLYNDFWDLASGGRLRPWSADGFFDICPYEQDGVSYPRDLSFSGNVIYPAEPTG